MVGEVAAAVAAATGLATKIVGVPTYLVPRHPALTVLAVEDPREGAGAAIDAYGGQVHPLLEVGPHVARAASPRRALILRSAA